MDYEEVFQKKNIDLVFDRTARRGNFIAAAYDEFTEFMDLGEFM